jgi:hypothetical protein
VWVRAALFALLVGCGADPGQTPIDADGDETCRRSGAPIRALYVGNSQIDFWDLPRMVESLSESAPAECARVEGDRFTVGGANLMGIWEEARVDGLTLAETIAQGEYDVVVIAESIDLVEFVPPYPDQFVAYATRIAEAARAAGAEPILYATPYVERPDREGFHQMAAPQLALGRRLGIRVAAGGLAWLRVWEVDPARDLFWQDRAHPGYEGSVVSSLVLWATIVGGNPIGLTPMPASQCETPCPAITEADAAMLQSAALEEARATGGLDL